MHLYDIFHGIKRKFADGFPNGSVIYLQVTFTKYLNKASLFYLKK